MLFEETVAVYCDNHTEHTNAHYEAECSLYIKSGGTPNFGLTEVWINLLSPT
jgi:hypothetical protein